jgi:hypothetical protein
MPRPATIASRILWIIVLSALISVRADELPAHAIVPGSKLMTPEEVGLRAEHPGQAGVVLVDESDRIDRGPSSTERTVHFRAKIFSIQDKDLYTVSMPLNSRPQGVLKKWWAWTVCPGKESAELDQKSFKKKATVQFNKVLFINVLSMTLEGVSPGCVVDYGYITQDLWFRDTVEEIEIQRTVPVRRFSFHWTPSGLGFGNYHLGGPSFPGLKTKRDGRSVLVTGTNLPAVVKEPFMPPISEVTAHLTIYYRPTGEKEEVYWEKVAKTARDFASYFAQPEVVKEALGQIDFSGSQDLDQRLRRAYDWLASNIQNSSAKTAEDKWVFSGKEKQAAPRAMGMLEKKQAAPHELSWFFQGMAQALGAHAVLVLATRSDRHYFEPHILDAHQIDSTLVAVRGPSEPDDSFRFLAPGSGLPYGQLPWWFTGSRALLADSKSARFITLPSSAPRHNASDTRAHLIVSASDPSLKADWSRTATGQQGYEQRLKLRGLLPGERRQVLGDYCGKRSGVEILRASAPDITSLEQGWHVECEADLRTEEPAPIKGEFHAGFRGDWIEPVPELREESRVYPVLFQYPRIDNTMIEIETQEGLNPLDEPPPILIEGVFGSYSLFVRPVEHGYQIQRSFSLTTDSVPVTDYASLKDFLDRVGHADATVLRFGRGSSP